MRWRLGAERGSERERAAQGVVRGPGEGDALREGALVGGRGGDDGGRAFELGDLFDDACAFPEGVDLELGFEDVGVEL